MQSRSFSAMLQELSDNYYNHLLSFQDFRLKRREILDQIDTYYNGADQNLGRPAQAPAHDLGSTITFASFEAKREEGNTDEDR